MTELGLVGQNSDQMSRSGPDGVAAINSNIDLCTPIYTERIAGFSIKVPTDVTSLTYYGCRTKDGIYGPIKDWEVNAATTDTTGEDGAWVDSPPACFAHKWIKIVSAGANADAEIVSKT